MPDDYHELVVTETGSNRRYQRTQEYETPESSLSR